MRKLLLIFAFTVPALAQSPCPDGCPDMAPISGRVLDFATGRPIAGAVVHYRGAGGTLDGDNQESNPPSIAGTVTTMPDGTYTLPRLPGGDFIVRTSASGYLGSKTTIPSVAASLLPYPGPQHFASIGDFQEAQSRFKLQPDPLQLQPMSDDALSGFALASTIFANRQFVTAALSPDGSRLGFITQDHTREPDGTSKMRCVARVYDTTSGKLMQVDLPGSPALLPRTHPDPPRGFCSGTLGALPNDFSVFHAVWINDAFYIFRLKFESQPPYERTGIETYALRDSTLTPVAADQLPPEIDALTANQTNAAPAPADSDNGVHTSDGRFSIEWDNDDSGECGSLTVTTLKPRRKVQLLGTSCMGSLGVRFLLDPDLDLLLYTLKPEPGHLFENFAALDLKTNLKRTFELPVLNRSPEFLTYSDLPSGEMRVAYAVGGDCDYAASDYAQPGESAGVLGNTPNQTSVCFITIPAPPPVPAKPAHEPASARLPSPPHQRI